MSAFHTVEDFISEMIYRDPQRIKNVIHPTMYHYHVAVYVTPSTIQYVPTDLQEQVLARIDAQHELENLLNVEDSDDDE